MRMQKQNGKQSQILSHLNVQETKRFCKQNLTLKIVMYISTRHSTVNYYSRLFVASVWCYSCVFFFVRFAFSIWKSNGEIVAISSQQSSSSFSSVRGFWMNRERNWYFCIINFDFLHTMQFKPCMGGNVFLKSNKQ